MANTFNLKPFIINLNDINFILDQVDFQPLFSAAGDAITNWDGSGSIYDPFGNQLWDGNFNQNITSAQDAMAAFGTSYAHLTSFQGVREVTGLNNNLLQVNQTWGAVDQQFVRLTNVNYNFLDMDLTAVPAVRLVNLGLPNADGSVNADNHLAEAIAALAGQTPVSAVLSSTSTDGPTFVNIVTTNLPGSFPISFNYQYDTFVRTTVDRTTETSTIGGGHNFVTWTQVDTFVSSRTDFMVTDANGTNVAIAGANSVPVEESSSATMSGGELDTAFHSFSAADVASQTGVDRYAPTITNSGLGVDATVTVENVIDYTPRMITQTITTGDVDMLTIGDLADAYPGFTLPPQGLNPNHIVYNTEFLDEAGTIENPAYTQSQDPNGMNSLGTNNFEIGAVEGIAIVQDYGQLADLGIQDNQNLNNDEYYVGSVNPGVAPTNGFFCGVWPVL